VCYKKCKKKKVVNAGHDPVTIRIPLELDINVKGDVAEIKVVKEKVEVKLEYIWNMF
ncbi:hypothetical protein A2U01_0048053, partial [Trifolium medium]|nr:hypothetical protein [Trifolium medium]